jgi:serine/threonine protein kinase
LTNRAGIRELNFKRAAAASARRGEEGSRQGKIPLGAGVPRRLWSMSWKFLKRSLQAIPNYRLLEKIQEGGMSSVYKGRHNKTGRTVAIKIIKANMAEDPTLLRRFEQEFRANSKLLHPNIVQALDFGRDESATYLVMEFVEGQTLGDLVDRQGRLSEGEAVYIITQIAQALHYAHKHAMIHRDVKPDNILLKPNGQAKLTDFGLVKDVAGDQKLTGPLSVLGTPHFMAPEQYTDAQNVDARCDVYSLAATLYWTVTARLPFDAGKALDVIKKQAANDLIPPRKLVPSLSEHLDAAIRKAMNPNRDLRPATCLAFVQSLKQRKKYRPSADAAASLPSGKRVEPRGAERRASVRFPCTIGTFCSTKSSFLEEAEDGEYAWPATVQDLSLSGLGVIVSRRFEPGTVLKVELEAADQSVSRSLMVSVVRVRSQGFGHWLVGCIFQEPLTPEELQVLL